MDQFKAVVFSLGTEEFGININQVSSIERMQKIHSLPNMPAYVSGIIELRGSVIPILDLKKMMWNLDTEHTDLTRIISVKVDDHPVGLIVDFATDVLDIPTACIQKPDFMNDANRVTSLKGIAKLNERMIILLDITKLLNYETAEDLTKIKNNIISQKVSNQHEI